MSKDAIYRFREVPKLYHYTNLNALERILESRTLRFSALPKMNDITEAAKEIYVEHTDNPGDWDILGRVEKELEHIGQISLCHDGLFNGYAINSMWGHYAQNGEGCCIILNRDIIIKECNELGLKFGSIQYDGAIPDLIIEDNRMCDDILEQDYDKYFMHKSYDWEHEQEFRIISFNMKKINSIPIHDALIAVAFHTNCKCRVFDCPSRLETLKHLGDIPALEYHYSRLWGNGVSVMLCDAYDCNWVG